ncbi:hypothetical protein GCM10007938_15870 [Vibrio zhanjiangensis]|uniref:Tox-PLDMTX domain-containing protein n=1 Tax=Vibrio zhanjiangensis TaxID=1046128 RepID=A0ABQ6EYA3_9VIBR|nr:M91 family zinc metallopeptidase [Vibrio zhanjiangensis]GLT17809.1 hypothetical protein GCM10007938_15870 [Vibrio zhanjiangensis]
MSRVDKNPQFPSVTKSGGTQHAPEQTFGAGSLTRASNDRNATLKSTNAEAIATTPDGPAVGKTVAAEERAVDLPKQSLVEALKDKQQEAIEFIEKGYNELIIEIDKGLVPSLRERIAEIRSNRDSQASNLGPSEETLKGIERFLDKIKDKASVNSDDRGLAYQFARHVKTSIQAVDEALKLGQMNASIGSLSQWEVKTTDEFLHSDDFFKNHKGKFEPKLAMDKLCSSSGQKLMAQHLVKQRTEVMKTLTANNNQLCNLYVKLDRYDKDVLGTDYFSMPRDIIGDIQSLVHKSANEFRGKAGVFNKPKDAWEYKPSYVTQKPPLKETVSRFFVDSSGKTREAFKSLTGTVAEKVKGLPSSTLGVLQELPKQAELTSYTLNHWRDVGHKKARKVGFDRIRAPAGLKTEEPKVKSIVRSMYWLMQQPALRMQYDLNPLQAAATNLKKDKPLEADFAAEAMQDFAQAVIDDFSTGKASGKEQTSSDSKKDKAGQIKEFHQACDNALEISKDIEEQIANLPSALQELVSSHSDSLSEWGQATLKTELKKIIDSKFYDPVKKELEGISNKLSGKTSFTENELGDIIHQTRIASLSGQSDLDNLDLKITSLTSKRLDPFSRHAKVAKDWGMKANEMMPETDIPTAESLRQTLQAEDLLDAVKSDDDPEGILFATRMCQEWHYARKDKIILPKTPEQHLADEKSFAEFAVKWGQKQATRGVIYAVIEGGVDLAAGATVTLVKGTVKAGVKTTIASFKIPYKVHQIKTGVMPGEDYPYKVVQDVVNNRLKQLGFKAAMSFVPRPIKTVAGGALVLSAYAHNAMVDPKDKIKTDSWLKTLAVEGGITGAVMPVSIAARAVTNKVMEAKLKQDLTNKHIPEQRQKLLQAYQDYTNGIKTQFEQMKQQFRDEMKDKLPEAVISEMIEAQDLAFKTDLAELQEQCRQKLSDSFDKDMQDLKSKGLIDSWDPLFTKEEEVDLEGKTDSMESVESEAERTDVPEHVLPSSAEATQSEPFPGPVRDWQYKVSEHHTIEIKGTQEYFDHVSAVFKQLSETKEGKRLLEALQGKDFSIRFPEPESYHGMTIYPATTDLEKNVISFDPLSVSSFDSDSAATQQPLLKLAHELIHILDKDNLIKGGSRFTEEDLERLEHMAVGIPYVQDGQTHDFSKTEVKQSHLKEGAPIFTVNQLRKELGLDPRTEYSEGVGIDDGELHYQYQDNPSMETEVQFYKNFFKMSKQLTKQIEAAEREFNKAKAMPKYITKPLMQGSLIPTREVNTERLSKMNASRHKLSVANGQLSRLRTQERQFRSALPNMERLTYAKLWVAEVKAEQPGMIGRQGIIRRVSDDVLIAEQYLKQVEDDIKNGRGAQLEQTYAPENSIQNVSDFKKTMVAELQQAYASGEFVKVYALILSKLDSVNQILSSGEALSPEDRQALEEQRQLLGQAERILFNQAFSSYVPEVRDLFFDPTPEETQRLVMDISSTISNDPSFEGYRWPLLPSERIYLEKYGYGEQETLADTILQYRQGRCELHENTEQVEAQFYASRTDIVQPNGEIYTAEQQILDIKEHGGLIQYEKEVMNQNRMTYFMDRVSPDSAAQRYWKKNGVDEPRKVKFAIRHMERTPRQVTDYIREHRGTGYQGLEQLIGKSITYNSGGHQEHYTIGYRDLESALGKEHLYSVNADELETANWSSEEYAQLLRQRATEKVGAISDSNERAATESLLDRVLHPNLYIEEPINTPYIIKPFIGDYPLENMIVIVDGDHYTMISLMPDGEVHNFSSRQELNQFFGDANNREYILSHASLYNQMDGRVKRGMVTILEELSASGNNANQYILKDAFKHKMNANNLFDTLAEDAKGYSQSRLYSEVDLVTGLKNNYDKGLGDTVTVNTEPSYELPNHYQTDSFNRLYKTLNDADLQPMITDEIDDFKNNHLGVFTQYLENQYKSQIEKAESDGVLSSQEADALRNIPDNAYVPSLSNGRNHYPLEGMLLTRQGNAIILVSLQSNGGVHKFNSEKEFNLFFANPANKDYILSHMSERNKQPGLLSSETPARSLEILASWTNKYYGTDFPAREARQYEGVVVLSENKRANVSHPQNIIGQSHVKLDQTDAFETMAGRMLDRLKSDADTLITSDAEWATDKFFEISGYILGAASIALTGGAAAGIGGVYVAGAAVVVDVVSGVHGVAEGLYVITQGDTAEERNFGLLPLALAPLDMFGAAGSAVELRRLNRMDGNDFGLTGGRGAPRNAGEVSPSQRLDESDGILKRLGLGRRDPEPSKPTFEPNEALDRFRHVDTPSQQQSKIDEIKDIVSEDSEIQRYINDPTENCENAAKRIRTLLRDNPDVENIRVVNMAFWDNALGNEADVYTNHWVIFAEYKGVDVAFDPTAGQFRQRLGISGPIFDTRNNWFATYQDALSSKRNTLAKIAEVDNFASAPFLSSGQFSGFQHVEGAQVLSDAHWYTSTGFDQNLKKAEELVNKNTEQAKRAQKMKEEAWRRYQKEHKNTQKDNPQGINSRDSAFGSGHVEGSNPSGPPQDLFLNQPHDGELSSFCGYYALSHYEGRELDLDVFREKVYEQFRSIGIPDSDIPQFVKDNGTGMESIAVAEYNFIESTDPTRAIESGRFMAATNRNGGHWLTYIRDNQGNWWEYDSWTERSLVGNEQQLRSRLQADNMTSVYYKNAPNSRVAEGLDAVGTSTHRVNGQLVSSTDLQTSGGFKPYVKPSGKQYIYFPFMNDERVNKRLIPLLRDLSDKGADPYEVVFKNQEQIEEFRRILIDTYGPADASSLEPKFHYLYGLEKTDLSDLNSTDMLYVSGHGQPGEGFIYSAASDTAPKMSAGDVAHDIDGMLLPEDVPVKVAACNSGVGNPEEIRVSSSNADHGELYSEITDRRNMGDFDASLTGKLENALMDLQPERQPGLVYGFLGFITNRRIRTTMGRIENGQLKVDVSTHASAGFETPTGSLVDFRRSDMMRGRYYEPNPMLGRHGPQDLSSEIPPIDRDALKANHKKVKSKVTRENGLVLIQAQGGEPSKKLYLASGTDRNSIREAAYTVWENSAKGNGVPSTDVLLGPESSSPSISAIVRQMNGGDLSQYDEVSGYFGGSFVRIVRVASDDQAEDRYEISIEELETKVLEDDTQDTNNPESQREEPTQPPSLGSFLQGSPAPRYLSPEDKLRMLNDKFDQQMYKALSEDRFSNQNDPNHGQLRRFITNVLSRPASQFGDLNTREFLEDATDVASDSVANHILPKLQQAMEVLNSGDGNTVENVRALFA